MSRGAAVSVRPDWGRIDTVLLDMDGTLLDKNFDDHFWEEHVPAQYAASRRIPLAEAKRRLMDTYRAQEGTLNWTDVDFWSEKLDLDIPALKRQVDHLIAVHDHVAPFLSRVRSLGKTVLLVTNAHGKTLDLKMEKTALAGAFTGIFTSHQLGSPKEDPSFWEALHSQVPFEPERALLAEDTEAVLAAAEAFGIGYLVHVSRPSSARPASASSRYFSIEDFREITP